MLEGWMEWRFNSIHRRIHSFPILFQFGSFVNAERGLKLSSNMHLEFSFLLYLGVQISVPSDWNDPFILYLSVQPIARFQGQATDVDLARKEVKNVKAELVSTSIKYLFIPFLVICTKNSAHIGSLPS